MAVQQQADHLKAWADQYLKNIAEGLRVLETDPAELAEQEQAVLYETLGAARFEEKYDGDRAAALRWAVLEEKRRTVRTLISEVLVVKEPDGGKKIIPQLAFEVPAELTSLVYDYQSLAYVEQQRRLRVDVEAGEDAQD